jgi:hypothetical protein
VNRENGTFNLGSLDTQNMFALLRILFLALTLYFFAAYCSTSFHDVDPRDMAEVLAQAPVLGWLPRPILIFIGAALNPYGLRYIIPPLAAFAYVLIAAAFYVKDVYALTHFKHAFRYVVASMFTLSYPNLKIDKGAKDIKKGEVNLLDKVGGPGFVSIEPGSATIFRHLREPGQALLSDTHFMAPFETIALTIDLDEQQEKKDNIKALTRDGIKVEVRDVHVRYRIKQAVKNGVTVRKTLPEPYPLDPGALQRMLNNLAVQSDGRERWREAVERAITGQITEFIAAHSIDYLTAPRGGFTNPRAELVTELSAKVRRSLENYGAELLWIDVGHLDIVPVPPVEDGDDSVDGQRTSLWAADWVGDTTVSKAYTEAIRQAYQDLGRAQAQAEIILSISDALANANLPNDTHGNVRRLLLARTAQVLDSLSTHPTNQS